MVLLRILFRVLFISAIIFIISIYYYSEPDNSEVLQDYNFTNPPKVGIDDNIDNIHDNSKRPEEGLSIYIGKSIDSLVKDYGEPDRKDPTAYGYEWWVFNGLADTYMQVGVQNDLVVTVYVIGGSLNVAPYKIGQTIEEIYRSTLLDTEITIALDNGTYRFELSEEDLNIRPLVQLGDIYVQLSLDKYTGTLSSVRFVDKKTLIIQSPYEMPFRGELVENSTPSEEEWTEIEQVTARQIFDITNVIRNRFELNQLSWDEQVADVAYEHSKDMFDNDYFSHTSPEHGDLSARLNASNVDFQTAGENIAFGYVDGPAVVEGWLNSEGHRTAMLEEDFTHLGVGVFENYYTQNFITVK